MSGINNPTNPPEEDSERDTIKEDQVKLGGKAEFDQCDNQEKLENYVKAENSGNFEKYEKSRNSGSNIASENPGNFEKYEKSGNSGSNIASGNPGNFENSEKSGEIDASGRSENFEKDEESGNAGMFGPMNQRVSGNFVESVTSKEFGMIKSTETDDTPPLSYYLKCNNDRYPRFVKFVYWVKKDECTQVLERFKELNQFSYGSRKVYLYPFDKTIGSYLSIEFVGYVDVVARLILKIRDFLEIKHHVVSEKKVTEHFRDTTRQHWKKFQNWSRCELKLKESLIIKGRPDDVEKVERMVEKHSEKRKNISFIQDIKKTPKTLHWSRFVQYEETVGLEKKSEIYLLVPFGKVPFLFIPENEQKVKSTGVKYEIIGHPSIFENHKNVVIRGNPIQVELSKFLIDELLGSTAKFEFHNLFSVGLDSEGTKVIKISYWIPLDSNE